MTLTGKTRVRVTRWRQKLILQVQTVRQPGGIIVGFMSDGTQRHREPDPIYEWHDATLADLQAVQLTLPDLQNENAA